MICEVCLSTAVSYDLSTDLYTCQHCGHSWFSDCDWDCPYRGTLHRHPGYPDVSLSDF